MDVKVLGTTFNLQARDEETTTELNLIKGKVRLHPVLPIRMWCCMPTKRAVLDKRTGNIKVIKAEPEVSMGWLRGELVFHATPIRKVFKEIERSYGVTIQIDKNEMLYNDLFTGTFSARNLNETLEILKMHYLL